jgi:hypothetical protein
MVCGILTPAHRGCWKSLQASTSTTPAWPSKVAFSVTDDGREEIVTGEIPYSYDLFKVFQEQGWLNIRRGVASIRESRGQRRTMSA